jgi:hypothetical protein
MQWTCCISTVTPYYLGNNDKEKHLHIFQMFCSMDTEPMDVEGQLILVYVSLLKKYGTHWTCGNQGSLAVTQRRKSWTLEPSRPVQAPL